MWPDGNRSWSLMISRHKWPITAHDLSFLNLQSRRWPFMNSNTLQCRVWQDGDCSWSLIPCKAARDQMVTIHSKPHVIRRWPFILSHTFQSRMCPGGDHSWSPVPCKAACYKMVTLHYLSCLTAACDQIVTDHDLAYLAKPHVTRWWPFMSKSERVPLCVSRLWQIVMLWGSLQQISSFGHYDTFHQYGNILNVYM